MPMPRYAAPPRPQAENWHYRRQDRREEGPLRTRIDGNAIPVESLFERPTRWCSSAQHNIGKAFDTVGSLEFHRSHGTGQNWPYLYDLPVTMPVNPVLE